MYSSFLTVIIPSILAFAVTVISTRFLMTYLYGAGIIAEDRNKKKPVKVPSSGGVAVSFGMIVGILVYTFGATFVFTPVKDALPRLLATALAITLITFVGFLDDINVKSERVKSTDRMDIREGLKQWQKPVLTLVGALPLIAINAGVSSMVVPFLGSVNLGLIYPLIILPLAIIFVSNSFNLLGGFDGLQPTMAIIAGVGLFVYSVFFGNYMGTLLSGLLVASVLAFLPFNTYMSKIIPGDSFTYAVGAALVAIMVMGNAEIFGMIVFMPWIIEFFLHLRRKFKVSDLGILQKDGTLSAPYGKRIYSLTHLIMNWKRVNEKEVTLYLSFIGAGFVILAFLLKLSGLI